ncbi:MAG: phosphonate ABC transporter, permease protein PhnE [Pseudomonadota bacterium]
MTSRHSDSFPALPVQGARRHCLRCWLTVGVLLAAVVSSFAYLAIDWAGLLSPESLRQMGRFLAEFFHPDLSGGFLRQTGWAALQTLALSSVGTLLAVAAGVALALPASGRFGGVPKALARLLLNVLRSMPELVWAALMVLAAGLGPLAGCLALALHTTGVLGRLFGETLENLPPAPEQALRQAGAGPVSAFAYACWPLAMPQWLGYALYRWEMNIRMATVLGFVGAGGLGQMLHFHLSLFQQAQAMTVLLGMFVLVIGVDTVSASIRARLDINRAGR